MNPGRIRTALRRTPFDPKILALAVPALGTLAADPLVSLIDTAFVGRLGPAELGALAVAGAIFSVAFWLFSFLAYGTTPYVASRIEQGRREEAGAFVMVALVVAAAAGIATAAGAELMLHRLLGAMGATGDVFTAAEAYLRIRLLALPAVLVINAANGAFRGLHDTRTPLLITLALNVVNLVLDPLLIFGAGWGIRGAAWATVAAQWLGAAGFLAVLFGRRRSDLGLERIRLQGADLGALLRAGRDLIIRSGALLAALTAATASAARIDTVAVAAHQVAIQIWIFLALVLDALAIAAQPMVAAALAAPARREHVALADRLLALGLGFGCLVGAGLAVMTPWLGSWFSDDGAVVAAIGSVLGFVVLLQPLNGAVFVWDGIAMGASAFRFLAAGTVAAALACGAVLGAGLRLEWGLAGVWWAIVTLMLVRAATLVWWHLARLPRSAPVPSSPAG